MDRPFPRRFDVSKFTFVFFALAVSIFGWGLQYKLSLYQPHTVTHSLPQAKLLSRDESSEETRGNADQQRGQAAPAMLPAALGCAFFLLFAAFRPVAGRIAALRSPWQAGRRPLRRDQAVLRSLFFRPPPALA